MNTQKQIFLIVVLFFVLVGGCAAYSFIDPVRADRQEGYFDSESIRRGALLFANNCRTCHGNQGQGGVGLALNIPDFHVQDPLVLDANRELIQRTLYCGRAGTAMPPWLNENGGSLTDTQIGHIINFLTAPVTNFNEDGTPADLPNKGWEEAVEFAHNLNHESSAIVAGDTLDTIATTHNIGGPQLAEMLGVAPDTVLEGGTVVDDFPAPLEDHESYEVESDAGMSVSQVADAVHLGAAIIAEANGLPYKVDGDSLTLFDEEGNEVPGLVVGTELQLPAGSVYVVQADDTLQGVADKHGISPDELVDLNDQLDVDDPETTLEYRNTLALPDGTRFRAGPDFTIASVAELLVVGEPTGAQLDELAPQDLADLNGIEDTSANLDENQELELPENTRFIVVENTSVNSLADRFTASPEDIAEANDIDDLGAELPTTVTLALPDNTTYVVQGQSVEDVAATLSGTSADAVAEANGISPDDPLTVGESLAYPEDAWGTAPSLSTTSPNVCVRYAVPQSVYQSLPGAEGGTEEGGGSGGQQVEAPEEISQEVVIQAHANDWTVVADGNAMPPNEGVVAIAPGTEVNFENVEGVHTITENGETVVPLFQGTDTHAITFNDEGQYDITCDFHPDMLAYIFVVEQ